MITNLPRIVRAVLTSVASLLLVASQAATSTAQVVINEIHYHPLEEAAFDPDGFPVLDLSQDVHEFVELYNAGSSPVSLSGWRIDSAVQFTFPPQAVIAPGGYAVIAADPDRLGNLPQYSIAPGTLLGPYSGRLGNGGPKTIKLKDATDRTVESVTYSSTFPWPTSADGLGASSRWTGIDPMPWQYRGRSLERLSPTAPSSDPANWKASQFPGDPTPGRANSQSRAVPDPVVLTHRISQASDGLFPILQGQEALVQVAFSGTNGLGKVLLEYFIDDVNKRDETVTAIEMTGTPPAYSARIPGLPGRSVARYRVVAERLPAAGPGPGAMERVLPREDDAFSWKAYFAVPPRVSTNDVYDLFVSTNSLTQLIFNMQDNPSAGWHPSPGTKVTGRFNDTEPGVLAYKGQVYDVQVRHSGSFYRRDFSRTSFKVEFPSYANLEGHSTLLILDKGSENMFGHLLFEAAGFPEPHVRPVDIYLNNQVRNIRLEFEETDENLMQRWSARQKRLHPGQPAPGPGHIWKASGYGSDVGPFGPANGTLLQTNEGWTPLQRYEWVYSSKTLDWEGYVPFKSMMDEMWTARGQTAPGSGPLDLPALRAYLASRWDVAANLDYLAIRGWMAEGDDTYHNHFEWKRSDGLWQMLPWDFDTDISEVTRSIFEAEDGNYFKDAFYKAYREEYKQRLWWLNNTLLHPDYLAASGLTHPNLVTFGPLRLAEVNRQTGYGSFERPARPAGLSPQGAESVAGAVLLSASPYGHSLPLPPAHASTFWEVRSATGTWWDPVYSATSSVALTSFEIPAGVLELGQLYYWRCTYQDSDGHPSLPSIEASFHFGGSFRRTNLVDLGATWRYVDAGTNQGKLWRDPAFNDSAWKLGAGLFGVSTGTLAVATPVNTPLALGVRTYYFRTRLAIPAQASRVSLRLRHLVDDGAVFYLNGAEVYRVNMGTFYLAGGIPFTAPAVKDIGQASLELPVDLPTTNLVQGENLLAVEVHQNRVDSPDVLFGLQLEATYEQSVGALRLNEVMAANRTRVQHDGLYPDWVELINPTDGVQPLAGLSLTDDIALPEKFPLPAGPLLSPHERVVVWCDAVHKLSGLAAPFGLASDGGSVWLFGKDASGALVEVDRVDYGLQVPDLSISRLAEGTGPWGLSEPTPGEANIRAELGSAAGLRINEWMASPTNGPDWFEVFNPELLPVSIGGMYFTDDLNLHTNSLVPARSYLPPWSFTRFIADSQQAQGATHVNFKLSGGGEAVGLFDSTGFMVDGILFGPQLAGISEGRLPDGGSTIRRFDSPTPGGSNLGDTDGDGMPDAWELAHGLNPLFNDASLDADGDGVSNLDEFLAGTDPTNPSSLLRLQWVPERSALRFAAMPGRVYEIQFREDVEQGDWQLLSSVSASAEGTLEIPIGDGSEITGRFYRIRLRRG